MNWQHCKMLVGNQRGVHGRVATRLAEIAAGYGVILQITRGEETVECCSILDVLALALVQGAEVSLRASGEKAKEALQAAQTVIADQDDP